MNEGNQVDVNNLVNVKGSSGGWTSFLCSSAIVLGDYN